MAQKFWKTQQFRSLQTEWEKKLTDSGFIDVEDDGGRLKQNSANSYRTLIHELIDGKRRYYELLGQHRHDECFKDEVERLIIERRACGVKIVDICLELRALGKRCHRDTIRLILRYYERKWKIRRT